MYAPFEQGPPGRVWVEDTVAWNGACAVAAAAGASASATHSAEANITERGIDRDLSGRRCTRPQNWTARAPAPVSSLLTRVAVMAFLSLCGLTARRPARSRLAERLLGAAGCVSRSVERAVTGYGLLKLSRRG